MDAEPKEIVVIDANSLTIFHSAHVSRRCVDPYSRPYFRRRSNALEGMAVASFLGVTSGVYIWRPFFQEMEINRLNRERRELEESTRSNDNQRNA